MRSFLDLAYKRHSCRNFCCGKTIEREKLTDIMRAAVAAPSAGNSQPWRYIAVDEPARVSQMANCIADDEKKFCQNAAAFIVVMEDKGGFVGNIGESIRNQRFIGIDLGASVAHILLAITDLELGGCVIGSFNERKIKTLLGIPKTRRIKLIIAVGFDDESEIYREKKRRPFEETVTFNKF